MPEKQKIKILAAGNIDFTGHEKMLPASGFTLKQIKSITNEEILNRYGAYDVLIIKSQRKLDKIFLSRCGFSAICTASKGTDHIDTAYAAKRGISIINSENGNFTAAAEHTMALILDIFKKTQYSAELIRKGKFGYWDFERRNLKGKTIGIIGTGKVGTQVARLSLAFGMKVLANDISEKVIRNNFFLNYCGIERLLKESDIVTLHIPYSKDNSRFIDESKLWKMKENGVFINTSRGGCVDETALLGVLKKRKYFYAGLDVFEKEPYINKEFMKLRNVIFTNHTAGKTLESGHNIIKEILMQVKNLNKK